MNSSQSDKNLETSQADGRPFRGIYNKHQFADYLAAVDASGSCFGAGRDSLFSEEELSLLENAHQFILDIDANILAYLEVYDSNLPELIDPYHDYTFQPKSFSTVVYDVFEKSIQDFHREFAHHPSFQIIAECRSELIDLSKIRSDMDIMKSLITQEGYLSCPSELDNLHRYSRQHPAQYRYYRLVAALLSLESSIETLNQLICQAFKNKTLIALDIDNVFCIQRSSHANSKSIRALAHPYRGTMSLRAGDLVLVKIKLDRFKIDHLCRIARIGISFHRDTGYKIDCQMRVVDENLSCFKGHFS
jgi:hypothetical protein